MDGPEAGTMPRSHVLVHGLDSRCTRELTELLVHVVGAGARVVADPDTEVLDFQGLLLVDLVDADNFTAGLLDFLQLPLETEWQPKTRHFSNGRALGCAGGAYLKKYQKRDFATTSLGAKIRMRYNLGVLSFSVGK